MEPSIVLRYISRIPQSTGAKKSLGFAVDSVDSKPSEVVSKGIKKPTLKPSQKSFHAFKARGGTGSLSKQIEVLEPEPSGSSDTLDLNAESTSPINAADSFVYSDNSSQTDFFKLVSTSLQTSHLPANSTFVLLGSRSSGKSFTLFGPEGLTDSRHYGIIPRVIDQLLVQTKVSEGTAIHMSIEFISLNSASQSRNDSEEESRKVPITNTLECVQYINTCLTTRAIAGAHIVAIIHITASGEPESRLTFIELRSISASTELPTAMATTDRSERTQLAETCCERAVDMLVGPPSQTGDSAVRTMMREVLKGDVPSTIIAVFPYSEAVGRLGAKTDTTFQLVCYIQKICSLYRILSLESENGVLDNGSEKELFSATAVDADSKTPSVFGLTADSTSTPANAMCGDTDDEYADAASASVVEALVSDSKTSDSKTIEEYKSTIENKLNEILRCEEYAMRCMQAERVCMEMEAEKRALQERLQAAESELRLIREVWKKENLNTDILKEVEESPRSDLGYNIVHLNSASSLGDILDEKRSTASSASSTSELAVAALNAASDSALQIEAELEVKINPVDTHTLDLCEPSVEDSLDDDDAFPMDTPLQSYFSPDIFDPASSAIVFTDRRASRQGLESGTTRSPRGSISGLWEENALLDESVAGHLKSIKVQYEEVSKRLDHKIAQEMQIEKEKEELLLLRERIQVEMAENVKGRGLLELMNDQRRCLELELMKLEEERTKAVLALSAMHRQTHHPHGGSSSTGDSVASSSSSHHSLSHSHHHHSPAVYLTLEIEQRKLRIAAAAAEKWEDMLFGFDTLTPVEFVYLSDASDADVSSDRDSDAEEEEEEEEEGIDFEAGEDSSGLDGDSDILEGVLKAQHPHETASIFSEVPVTPPPASKEFVDNDNYNKEHRVKTLKAKINSSPSLLPETVFASPSTALPSASDETSIGSMLFSWIPGFSPSK